MHAVGRFLDFQIRRWGGGGWRGEFQRGEGGVVVRRCEHGTRKLCDMKGSSTSSYCCKSSMSTRT